MLHVECAWCGVGLGSKEGGHGVSHGLCQGCRDQWEVEARRFLALWGPSERRERRLRRPVPSPSQEPTAPPTT